MTGPNPDHAGFIEGSDSRVDPAVRQCFGRHAIQVALGGYQSIRALIAPVSRLYRNAQRHLGQTEQDPRRELRQADGCTVRVPVTRPECARDHNDGLFVQDLPVVGEDPGRCRAPGSTQPTTAISGSSRCRGRGDLTRAIRADRQFPVVIPPVVADQLPVTGGNVNSGLL